MASRGPAGVWMVAGTPFAERYPCMCYGSRACGMRCPCRGRADGADMPTVCCARRAHDTTNRTEKE